MCPEKTEKAIFYFHVEKFGDGLFLARQKHAEGVFCGNYLIYFSNFFEKKRVNCAQVKRLRRFTMISVPRGTDDISSI